MTSKKVNPVNQLREKVFNLLNKRSKYVDPRSFDSFKRSIWTAKTPKLNNLYAVLKNIKKIDGQPSISKKSFSSVLVQAEQVKKQEYKVTVYATFRYTYPKSKKLDKAPQIKREAIATFNVANKSDKSIQRMINEKLEDYEEYANDIDSSHSIQKSIVKLDFEKSAVAKQNVPLNKIPMKNAFVLEREWLRYAEGIDRKSYDDMKGECVYELLAEHLSNPTKRINMTKDKLFDIFNGFHNSQNGVTDLDYGVFDNNFTISSGVTTEMIKYLCELRKISLYAFDAKENCFEKVIHSHTSNYKPIVYYMIDGHMYLITDKQVVKSLTSAEKVNKNMIISSMLEGDDEKPTKCDIIECKTFDEALKQKNCVVYLSAHHITEEVYQYIKDTKSVPKLKVEHHQIVQMITDNVTIRCDQNITDGYTWKDIKAICEKADIPFKNQRIGGLISALRKKFFKLERRVLTAEEKTSLVDEQESKCMTCESECKDFEFDHIQSLANGGSNELTNFQALCKPCHQQKTVEERENSDFIKFDPVASTFNEKALEIIQSNHFKQWAFIEKLHKRDVNMENVHKIDHAKCRRNIVMNSKFDYPMYSVMDYPTKYDGLDIKCGNYYVETDNYFPMRGNGWYNYTMVNYCIEKNISLKITHQFIPSFTIKNDYFKKFAEFLLELTQGSDIAKLIVNSLVGCWGIQSTHLEHIRLTTDKYDASSELCREGVFVKSHQLAENVTLYSIIDKLMIKKDDMFLPLYNQIVAIEAIELHRLENMIIEAGCMPLERNTDAILYRGKQLDISSYFWDTDMSVPKYRYDEPTLLTRDAVCSFIRTGSFKPASFNFNLIQDIETQKVETEVERIVDYTIVMGADGYAERIPIEPMTVKSIEKKTVQVEVSFDDIIEKVVKSDKGCLVTGVAGTGKTYFANKLVSTLEAAGKRCDIKLAPTNKAASHINGKTIHKYYLSLFLSNNYEKKILKSLNNVDYIIIDEISMVKEVFYRFFTLIKRYVPKIKFIIIGDFAQFKPVNDVYTGSYKDSPALHHLCDGQQVNLTKCRRSDSELFNLYTNVGSVNTSRFPFVELTDLNIAYSHRTRKTVNRQCMDKFSEGQSYLIAHRSKMNKKTQTSKLFVGMPIVSYRNLKKENIFNSEVFNITKMDFDKKTFSFMDDNTEHTYHVNQFSSMFYPAFCITAHTSQGCTFTKPYTIWDWNHPRMDETAKYVSLSRATSINNIQIVV